MGVETSAPVAQQLMEKGRVQWAYLGVALRELEPQIAAQVGVPIREGVLVADMNRDGPAWRAGIRAGDVIVSIGGQKVSTVRELIRLLRHEHSVDEKVEVTIFREEKEMTLEVKLGERPTR